MEVIGYFFNGVMVMSLLKNYSSYLFSLVLACFNIFSNEFIQKHLPPAALLSKIDQHKDLLYAKMGLGNHVIETFAEIPGFYVKTDPKRVLYRDFIESVIKENNLNCLGVPEKYIHKIGSTWLVFAKKVETGGNILPLSAEEKRQIKILEEKTDYWDWHFSDSDEWTSAPNWIRNKQNKIICIDSEERSFQDSNRNKVNWTNRFQNYLG